MKIGEVIVNLRKEQGIKQKDLAANLGISATHLSLIEHNESKPSVTLLTSIAECFNLPVTALLFKAMDKNDLSSKEQKMYFKAAQPIVDALIKFLLPAEGLNAKRKRPLVYIKAKKNTLA